MMSSTIKKISVIFSLLIGLFSTSFVSAYVYMECNDKPIAWPKPSSNSPTPIAPIAMSVGYTFADHTIEALRTAINRWNAIPAAVRISMTTGDRSVQYNNDSNEIWWSSEVDFNGSGAVTFVTYSCDRIYETDIAFNSQTSIPFYTGEKKKQLIDYNGDYQSFISTAMHELGHVVGLKHTANKYSLMGNSHLHYHVNGSNARTYVGEDATKGALRMYGGVYQYNPIDLAVTQFKHNVNNPSTGEYSNHMRTVIYDKDGRVPGAILVASSWELHYYVKRGETYDIEFSFENLTDTDSLTVDVGMYLSNNDNITTSDRFLKAHNNMRVAMGNVYTRTISVKIPEDLELEEYYFIGAIIDHNNEYSLDPKNNNAAYIGIKVKP